MPNYNLHDPKGWCGDPSRGAALGRPTIEREEPSTYAGKLTVRKIGLTSGGYDKNGTYFGHSAVGQSLYWCANHEGTIDFTLRAFSRNHAIAIVRRRYPKAQYRMTPLRPGQGPVCGRLGCPCDTVETCVEHAEGSPVDARVFWEGRTQ